VTTTELLTTCRQAGVTLAASGNRVRVSAPAGIVTPTLRAALTARKPELLHVMWRLEGMRRHTEPVPTAKSVHEAPGGPGHCFSCGDPLDHPQAYGRCTWCWLAVEAFYAERAANARESETEQVGNDARTSANSAPKTARASTRDERRHECE
jgi:hypothetical protein